MKKEKWKNIVSSQDYERFLEENRIEFTTDPYDRVTKKFYYKNIIKKK